jgi:LysM repeat protein
LTLAGLVLRAVLSLTMLPLSAVAQQGYEVQGPYHASPMTPSHGAYAYQQQGYGQPGSWQGGPPPYEQQPVASLPRARQKSPPAYQQRPVQQPVQNAGNYNGNGQPYAYPSSVAAAPVPKAPSKSRSPEYGQMPKNNYTTNTYPRNNGNPNAVTPGKVNAYAAPQVVNDISDLKVNDRVQDRRLAELESRLSKGTNVPESSGYATHTVRSSDTLWRISDKYGTTPTQIKAANRLTNDVVTEGQTLIIPTKRASAMKSSHTAGNSAPPSGTHTVQQGETLSGIAASYGIPTSVLQSSNGISNNPWARCPQIQSTRAD